MKKETRWLNGMVRAYRRKNKGEEYFTDEVIHLIDDKETLSKFLTIGKDINFRITA